MVISDHHLQSLFTKIVKLACSASFGLNPTVIKLAGLIPKALKDFGVTFESSEDYFIVLSVASNGFCHLPLWTLALCTYACLLWVEKFL